MMNHEVIGGISHEMYVHEKKLAMVKSRVNKVDADMIKCQTLATVEHFDRF